MANCSQPIAGCGNNAVGELIDVVVAELRRIKEEPPPEDELRRAKDHLKGSLMLGLESTSSRMSNLARQEMYFDRQFSLDETLQSVEAVTRDDVRRVTDDPRHHTVDADRCQQERHRCEHRHEQRREPIARQSRAQASP